MDGLGVTCQKAPADTRHPAPGTLIMSHILPLLAQASNKSDAMPWALVLFCVILGLLVSLNPPRRTYEIKRAKED
jgi:hypothetical protein